MNELVEKRRELKDDWEITHWSLVKSPANRQKIIVKSDGSVEGYIDFIHKDAELGLAYVNVYPPDMEDSQGDYATKETVRKWAHAFLRKGRTGNVDYEHNYKNDYGDVVESYILRGTDPMFPNAPLGSWLGVIQLSDEGKAVIDDVTGVSFAATRMVTKSDGVFASRIVQESTGTFASRII